jgi:hypothetical protein
MQPKSTPPGLLPQKETQVRCAEKTIDDLEEYRILLIAWSDTHPPTESQRQWWERAPRSALVQHAITAAALDLLAKMSAHQSKKGAKCNLLSTAESMLENRPERKGQQPASETKPRAKPTRRRRN